MLPKTSPAGLRPLASLSVDLDPLGCYTAIYGLPPPDEALRAVVLRRALPRFLQLFARDRVRAPFFVVGSHVQGEESAAPLRQALAAGHELGNHSYRHPYDLARRPRAAIAKDVGACHEALRRLQGGAAPRGFRSPGYDMSVDLFDVLQALGY